MEQAPLVSPPPHGPVPSLNDEIASSVRRTLPGAAPARPRRDGTGCIRAGMNSSSARSPSKSSTMPPTHRVATCGPTGAAAPGRTEPPRTNHGVGCRYRTARHRRAAIVSGAGTGTGTTLLRRLARGPLSAELVAEIGQQLATTLAYLHQHGLVHGGVHPAAVLLSTPPPGHPRPLTVKLSDASTAHVLEDTITPNPVATRPGPDRRPEHAAEADLGPRRRHLLPRPAPAGGSHRAPQRSRCRIRRRGGSARTDHPRGPGPGLGPATGRDDPP